MVPLIRLTRPRQWLKNLLVLAVPTVSGSLGESRVVGLVMVGLLVFVLLSSATYCVNDVIDAPKDRKHAAKRLRPVANGEVRPGTALMLAGVLIAAAGVLCLWLPVEFALFAAAYLAWTIAYSLVLKRAVIVDLLGLGAGFVLRALAGAAVVEVTVSSWFILTVAGGSLLLASGKRLAELRSGGDTREVLHEYSESFLVQVTGLTAVVTLMAYALWALGGVRPTVTSSVAAELTLVPLLYGTLRYLLLIARGEGEAPEDLLTRDRGLVIAGIIFALLSVLAFYS